MAQLTERQRKHARNLAAEAALVGYRNRQFVHYTQGGMRWSGISQNRQARRGQYPTHADCSAYTTWCLWNGLWIAYGRPDTVNRTTWKYGFTGSQIRHGRAVAWTAEMRKGDLVFYANSGHTPTHVAIMVGREGGKRNGTPMVISHGNESGPLYLPYNYRRIVQVRRYIHNGI